MTVNRRMCVLLGLVVLFAAIGNAQENLDSLIAALKSGDDAAAAKTEDKLAKIGKPATEPLYALIREENASAKEDAAEAFARAAGGNISGARQAQSEARRHDTNISRAFHALNKIGSPSLEVLVKALNDGQSRYRSMVLDSFVAIGDKSAIAPLKAFADKEPAARDDVLKALAKLEARN